MALIDRRIRKVLKRLHFTKGTYPMCMKPSGRTLYVGDKVIFCFLIYKIIEPLLCILSIWYDGMLDDENEALIMRKKIFLENFYMKNLSSKIYFVDFLGRKSTPHRFVNEESTQEDEDRFRFAFRKGHRS